MGDIDRVGFPHSEDFDWEVEQKGWLEGIEVDLSDGRRFRLKACDPVSLAQSIERLAETGTPYFAEPTMIVVPSVTREHIAKAVQTLFEEGYFNELLPLPPQK